MCAGVRLKSEGFWQAPFGVPENAYSYRRREVNPELSFSVAIGEISCFRPHLLAFCCSLACFFFLSVASWL